MSQLMIDIIQSVAIIILSLIQGQFNSGIEELKRKEEKGDSD